MIMLDYDLVTSKPRVKLGSPGSLLRENESEREKEKEGGKKKEREKAIRKN